MLLQQAGNVLYHITQNETEQENMSGQHFYTLQNSAQKQMINDKKQYSFHSRVL